MAAVKKDINCYSKDKDQGYADQHKQIKAYPILKCGE
jgi:hypothetical protein